MSNGRFKPITIRGVKERQHNLDELLDVFAIDGFVPQDEFIKDMSLLTNGEMSPEEHRVYLKTKYGY